MMTRQIPPIRYRGFQPGSGVVLSAPILELRVPHLNFTVERGARLFITTLTAPAVDAKSCHLELPSRSVDGLSSMLRLARNGVLGDWSREVAIDSGFKARQGLPPGSDVNGVSRE